MQTPRKCKLNKSIASCSKSLKCGDIYFIYFLPCQAGVSNTYPDHGGSQRSGCECSSRAAEGQQSKGHSAGVNRRRGEGWGVGEWSFKPLHSLVLIHFSFIQFTCCKYCMLLHGSELNWLFDERLIYTEQNFLVLKLEQEAELWVGTVK